MVAKKKKEKGEGRMPPRCVNVATKSFGLTAKIGMR